MIEIVKKPPDLVGFAVHPSRRVVEGFFAWTSRNRRIWKDPKATLTPSPGLPLCHYHHAPRPPLGTDSP
jgi:hypothetical protein